MFLCMKRQAKAYEAAWRQELARLHPNLTPDETKYYGRRIKELLAEFQRNQARSQQQAQAAPARSRQQERATER